MAVWAIGDIQGCYQPLDRLLKQIRFDTSRDTLWFTGDLVNRGPDSLRVLRFVRGLGDRAITVLGNHDLHLLAVDAGQPARRRDTFDEVLRAPDRRALVDWLRQQPLLHHDHGLGYTMVHAGLLPGWTLDDAARLAAEAEAVLKDARLNDFVAHMYGNLPDRWSEQLHGHDRTRVIINAFTRLRYCDLDGGMDLHQKGAPGSQPADLLPWFAVPKRRNRDLRVVFGHWSTLGRYSDHGVIGLDSGCVWGVELTAVRLDTREPEFVSVPCPRAQSPHG
ncbi:MAG: bis(5'-nucleosyl)-tetraphosphatase (symmetrical) [Candidatus Muproteobacteria bacterium RBG_16_64_10]|uniref:Bis(5'-nucleosyl)-tetraphosphatase, symmetrical n=1 Tax=Candidatus Muproteobacteria bacterium RBG_16_64_10 TaxID=1817757 RepID=A0A1F6SWU9_9PROT|nr:MAG: bis(5'-nucleosyl)-tetraphosphatase (symmetrical) [Candidatus Muproteobacteria bacterium RBG_16_64_10]